MAELGVLWTIGAAVYVLRSRNLFGIATIISLDTTGGITKPLVLIDFFSST